MGLTNSIIGGVTAQRLFSVVAVDEKVGHFVALVQDAIEDQFIDLTPC